MRKEYVEIWPDFLEAKKYLIFTVDKGNVTSLLHIEQKAVSTSRSIAFIQVQGVSFPIQGTPTVASVTGLWGET